MQKCRCSATNEKRWKMRFSQMIKSNLIFSMHTYNCFLYRSKKTHLNLSPAKKDHFNAKKNCRFFKRRHFIPFFTVLKGSFDIIKFQPEKKRHFQSQKLPFQLEHPGQIGTNHNSSAVPISPIIISTLNAELLLNQRPSHVDLFNVTLFSNPTDFFSD